MDFDFWVTYGSWSSCVSCGSFFFNDDYFREVVYESRRATSQPDLLCVSRRTLSSDPCEHSADAVGQGSRWWYLPGMYRPSAACGRCTPSATGAAVSLLEAMRARQAEYEGAASNAQVRTQQLYVLPRIGDDPRGWAAECATWPRYHCGSFSLTSRYGDSMLDLSKEEQQAPTRHTYVYI